MTRSVRSPTGAIVSARAGAGGASTPVRVHGHRRCGGMHTFQLRPRAGAYRSSNASGTGSGVLPQPCSTGRALRRVCGQRIPRLSGECRKVHERRRGCDSWWPGTGTIHVRTTTLSPKLRTSADTDHRDDLRMSPACCTVARCDRPQVTARRCPTRRRRTPASPVRERGTTNLGGTHS